MASPAGGNHDHRRIGRSRHFDLDLTNADGLDEHHVQPGRGEDPDRFRRSCGQAAQVTTRSHGAVKDGCFEGVTLHPHSITEDGSTREGRRRVDGEHTDLGAVGGGQADDQLIGKRGLPGTRRSGNPDGMMKLSARAEGQPAHLFELVLRPAQRGKATGPAIPCRRPGPPQTGRPGRAGAPYPGRTLRRGRSRTGKALGADCGMSRSSIADPRSIGDLAVGISHPVESPLIFTASIRAVWPASAPDPVRLDPSAPT